MLHLRRRPLDTIEHIRAALLGAIRLELATLPAYLTALYSIIPGRNVEIARILKSVAMEEMLHLGFACNILNAVGGHPTINAPGFAPVYPGPLPMDIGDQPGKPFIVPIKRLSIDLVRDVFMVIEEPADPLVFDTPPEKRAFHTIGEFYEAVKSEIVKRGEAIFTGDPALQATGRFGENVLFPVTGVKSAGQAIDVIIEQGEGTSRKPLDLEGQLAHYYLFCQIVEGSCLVPSRKDPEGWAYSGAKIPFDPDGVFPMIDNPATVPLPQDDLVATWADEFDQTYTVLLNALHRTFNGHPTHVYSALGVMFSLRIQAQRLMGTPIPGRKFNAGPRWKYVPPP
jgi:hypothetical protein